MRAKRGFTLIEIMVVLVIIGITSSVTLLAFGDFGASRKVLMTAQHFSSYIKLVQQRAILETNTFGIRVNEAGYETLRLQQGVNWQPLPENGLFRPHFFPKNIRVTLAKPLKNSKNTPEVIIHSSGDMSLFQLNFGTHDHPSLVTLIGRHNGSLHLKSATS